MKDDRLLRAAIRRREQEDIIARGREIKATAGGRDFSSVNGKCAVCRCTMRVNTFGRRWCTQTAKHRHLS